MILARLWNVRSLRVRLLISLMMAICTIWASWFLCQAMQMSRQQTGNWDLMMKATGQQILRSLPPGMTPVDRQTGLSLPPEIPVLPAHLYYQVWHRNGQSILQSANAPAQAWVPLRFDEPHWLGQADLDGQAWRVYTITDATHTVQVQVAKLQSQLDAELALWFNGSLVIAGLLIVLLGTVSWWTICWTMRPVRQLRDTLVERAALDLRPLPLRELPQELRPLVEGFNGVLGQLDTALRAERHFLADAAHELRTPLAVLTAQARLVQSAQTLEESREAMAPLMCGIERTARLTEQLLDSARVDASADPAAGGAVTLHEIVSLVLHDFDPAARQRQQRLLLDTEPCALPVDVDTLGVLLRNLIDNAQRYSGTGARIQVVCRRVRMEDGWCVALGVRDDGPGVPASARDRIFDRFYRVPGTTGRGSGIGLSLVARIAELHGATIDVGEGLDGRGFGITVRFTRYRVDPPADCPDSSPALLAPVTPSTAATTP